LFLGLFLLLLALLFLGLLVGWKDVISEIQFHGATARDEIEGRMVVAQALSKVSVEQADD
jgi:hypothetical protein